MVGFLIPLVTPFTFPSPSPLDEDAYKESLQCPLAVSFSSSSFR